MLPSMHVARGGLLLALLAGTTTSPYAQQTSTLPRVEAGLETADIRTGCIGQKNCYLPSAALGIAAAVNLSPRLALETTWSQTLQTPRYSTNQADGHESELLAGIRGELRARHFAYYAAGGLGYRRWSNRVAGATFTTTSTASITFIYGPRTDLAASFAGGVEVSPTTHLHIRGGLGDLLINQGGSWTSNLQPSIAVVYGFGKPLLWTPPRYVAREQHPFFDKPNVALLAINTLASTADNVTTYQFMQRGIPEGDPITRPLIKYGIPGQVSSQILETGVLIVGMYGFHRLHQRWLERLVPLVDATGHAILAYHNTQSYSRSQPTR